MVTQEERRGLLLGAAALAMLLFQAAPARTRTGTIEQNASVDAQAEPLETYILPGASNMVGFGRIEPEEAKGALAWLTRKENEFPHLLADAGVLAARADVWYVQVSVGQQQRWLQPQAEHFGP